MSDELIQRYKRELERAGVSPLEVARGLLGGKVYVVRSYHFDGGEIHGIYTDEVKAVEVARWLWPSHDSLYEGVCVDEVWLDRFEKLGLPSEDRVLRTPVLRRVLDLNVETLPRCRACGEVVQQEGLCGSCESVVRRDEARLSFLDEVEEGFGP